MIPIAFWFHHLPALPRSSPPCPSFLYSPQLSILAFVTTLYLVPALGPRFIQTNLKEGICSRFIPLRRASLAGYLCFKFCTVLRMNPDSPTAVLVAGEWRCFWMTLHKRFTMLCAPTGGCRTVKTSYCWQPFLYEVRRIWNLCLTLHEHFAVEWPIRRTTGKRWRWKS